MLPKLLLLLNNVLAQVLLRWLEFWLPQRMLVVVGPWGVQLLEQQGRSGLRLPSVWARAQWG